LKHNTAVYTKLGRRLLLRQNINLVTCLCNGSSIPTLFDATAANYAIVFLHIQ